MSNAHVKYLLIGGGLASSSAAEAIRRRDPEGAILLVGQEISRPYHRPPLSKEYLRRQKPHQELFTHEPNWFAEQHVELRTGRRASHLDTARRTVFLDSGEEISFDKLLIATGGSPRRLEIPGADLPNIFYLRSLQDVERLHHAIDKARHEGLSYAHGRGRVTILGGGVLGVELAASMRQLGLTVDLIVAKNHPWHKFAGENTGWFLTRYLESRGVNVFIGRYPRQLEGDGRVQRVILEDGTTIRCDFVVAAIGMTVNKDILRGTPIAAEKAILTDAQCRTNHPDIYAAGDCAAIFDPLFGKHRVLDHWDNAIVTGRLAGGNMTGADEHYDAVNYFFSDLFDLSLSAWGEAKLVDRRLVRGVPGVESPDFLEFGIAADGRIAQILAVNHRGEDQILREMVRRRIRINGNEEALKDPAFPLMKL